MISLVQIGDPAARLKDTSARLPGNSRFLAEIIDNTMPISLAIQGNHYVVANTDIKVQPSEIMVMYEMYLESNRSGHNNYYILTRAEDVWSLYPGVYDDITISGTVLSLIRQVGEYNVLILIPSKFKVHTTVDVQVMP